MSPRRRLVDVCMTFLSEDRAVASVLFIVSLPMFLVLAGLGIDIGAAYSNQIVLQNAADAAALAAALDLRSNTSSACSQGQNYASTNLPSAANGTVLQAADCTTGYWSFSNNTYESCGASTVTCVDSNPVNAVRVLLRREKSNGNQLPISFMALMGWDHWNLSAVAIAAIPGNGGVCFFANGDVSMGNNGSISLNGCNAQFDGNLIDSGNGKGQSVPSVTTSPGVIEFNSSETSQNQGVSLTGTVVNGAPTPNNPYANTPAPSTSSCVSGTVNIDSTHLPAANSCFSGTVNFNSSVTLAAGYYVFNGATVSVPGNNITISGSGVTLITEGNVSLDSKNDLTLSLTAPTSGTYQGLAIFGVGSSDLTITGKNSLTMNIVGAIYFPSGTLDLKNNGTTVSGSCLQFDVNTLSVDNNLNVSTTDNCSSAGVFAIGHARLVL